MESASGEITVRLGSKDIVLRPSFAAVEGFERACDRGALALARDWQAGELRSWHVAHIVHQCARAGGSKLSYEDIGRYLRQAGVAEHINTAGALLVAAITGGVPNAEAAPAERATTATTETATTDSPGAAS